MNENYDRIEQKLKLYKTVKQDLQKLGTSVSKVEANIVDTVNGFVAFKWDEAEICIDSEILLLKYNKLHLREKCNDCCHLFTSISECSQKCDLFSEEWGKK